MELSLSSIGISAINPHCKASSCHPKPIHIKLNAKLFDLSSKCFKNGVSVGLYSHRSCSKPVPTRQFKRNSIWACSQVGAAGSDSMLNKIYTFKDACWRFLRPHTIRGTALGSAALVARALIENPSLIKWSLLLKAFSGLIALICGNGYIVGINQIYDIGIDKVNKPYLPIAAGDLSVQSAWFLVIFFAVTGLLIVGYNFGPFITALYSFGLFPGTIYSVPPFRMKRFPVAAFLIIATAKQPSTSYKTIESDSSPKVETQLKSTRMMWFTYSVIAELYSIRLCFGVNLMIIIDKILLLGKKIAPVAFITTFVTLFAPVIAITKDLPDVEGDRKFQISTLATKLGVRNIAFLGSGLLLVNYVAAVLAAVYMPQAFRLSLMIPAHIFLALCLIFQAWLLEQAYYTKEAISGFYRFIWNLFYTEYAIFPFV
ncbi:hypothetical protein REPUB_Repub06bG0139700 [Reevesia pubescens]